MPAKIPVASAAIKTLGNSRATGKKNSIMNSVLAMPSAHTGRGRGLEFQLADQQAEQPDHDRAGRSEDRGRRTPPGPQHRVDAVLVVVQLLAISADKQHA